MIVVRPIVFARNARIVVRRYAFCQNNTIFVPLKTKDAMELYEHAAPEVMTGKKILFLHGFASSGRNGSVKTLRTLLPQAQIIAPDLPEHPADAMAMLRSIVDSDRPDLVIGTSMGAMYAEQLHGTDRILVNPAFCLADTILKNNGLGRQDYHNPREDGQTSFLVTKGLLEEYRECSAECFSECDDDHVWGLFGTRDTLVDTFGLFSSHYSRALRFDGEHYMNDHVILRSVMPVIRRIDDAQEGKARRTLFVSILDTLAGPDGLPVQGAVNAYMHLSQSYDTYVLASAPYNTPEAWSEPVRWAETHLGTVAWDKVVVSNRKDLILGDYIIDRHTDSYRLQDSMGTVIGYGSDPYRTWDDIVTFFDRLAGQ